MYTDTINHFANVAEKKTALLKNNPLAFYIGAFMAGAYLGMGIVLVFTVGGLLDPSVRPLVMGASFGRSNGRAGINPPSYQVSSSSGKAQYGRFFLAGNLKLTFEATGALSVLTREELAWNAMGCPRFKA